MPELVMERPKMSLQMHETLKKYILRERRKKKEEDVANEQKMMEEMRKAEINTQTIEQNEQQLKQLAVKLEDLQAKKRELFNQLKKVLNEENNLKKNNRPVIPSLPYGQMPGSDQMLLFNQQNIGPPSLISQPNVLNQLSQSPGIIPISSASSTPTPISSSLASTSNSSSQQSNIIQPSPLHPPLIANNSNSNSSKPQSPFHPPTPHNLSHHLVHNPSNFPLVPPGPLGKYGLPPALSPQLLPPQQAMAAAVAALAAAQNNSSGGHPLNQSRSNSPATNLISSSPRHQASPAQNNLLSTPSNKRIRSPSPSSSPIHHPGANIHSQHASLLYAQNSMIPPSARSPIMIPASPPPSHLQPNQLYNSPNTNKKPRSSLMVSIPNSSQSISSNQSPQHHSNRQSSGNPQQSLPPPQQQSAFSPFHNSIISNRGLNSYPPQQPQQHQQQQQLPLPPSSQSNKQLNSNSNSIQSYSPLPSPNNFSNMSRNMPAPPLPPPSQSPTLGQFQPLNYLNALAHETAQKMIMQQHAQNQQNLQQQYMQQQILAAMSQQHLGHLPMHHHAPNQANSNTGSGGGSILTGHGFSVRSNSGGPQQPPPF